MGIFVGVKYFSKDLRIAELPYAVDDAVDLAYLFSRELHLIEPGNVWMLLSGDPQKPETLRRLADLKKAGIHLESAQRTDIFQTVYQRIGQAGAGGLLVISFATHGFTFEGEHYLMAQDSTLGVTAFGPASGLVDTAFSRNHLFDALAKSAARRQLILLDACREHLVASRSSLSPDPRTVMPALLKDTLDRSTGAALLEAARPGGYAFDDPRRRNGVFTGAILDGLRCQAKADEHGFVTIEKLADFVDSRVADWVRNHEGNRPGWELGIERTLGGSPQLPLASCQGAPRTAFP